MKGLWILKRKRGVKVKNNKPLKKALHFVLSLQNGYHPSVMVFGQIKIVGESAIKRHLRIL